MKRFDHVWVKIVAAVVVGFLLAGAGTHITYACAPVDGAQGCVSFDKAVMHPSDLLANKQGSLVHFSTAFILVTCVSFALLWALPLFGKKVKPEGI